MQKHFIFFQPICFIFDFICTRRHTELLTSNSIKLTMLPRYLHKYIVREVSFLSRLPENFDHLNNLNEADLEKYVVAGVTIVNLTSMTVSKNIFMDLTMVSV